MPARRKAGGAGRAPGRLSANPWRGRGGPGPGAPLDAEAQLGREGLGVEGRVALVAVALVA